jgi:hypothetical protein
MYELESGRQAPSHDWTTSTFHDKATVDKLPLQLSYGSKFWQHETGVYWKDLIEEIHCRDPAILVEPILVLAEDIF